ncbi:MAG TPA: AraC family transcriptional regulator ligand-binding domain-containing protein, partial [Moraxellaceae bacterium]|nr:AraC family transcriptional regulator ligand-binding domain-containing protein [Moraxellaceae bacterium]
MKKSTRSVERSLIAVSYAYDLLHVMEDRGASSEAIIRDSQIPSTLLKGHDARITAAQFASLVRACASHGDVAGLGYAFGLNVKLPSHGLLGLAMVNCRTPREAMQLGERFSPLRSGIVRLRVIE